MANRHSSKGVNQIKNTTAMVAMMAMLGGSISDIDLGSIEEPTIVQAPSTIIEDVGDPVIDESPWDGYTPLLETYGQQVPEGSPWEGHFDIH